MPKAVSIAYSKNAQVFRRRLEKGTGKSKESFALKNASMLLTSFQVPQYRISLWSLSEVINWHLFETWTFICTFSIHNLWFDKQNQNQHSPLTDKTKRKKEKVLRLFSPLFRDKNQLLQLSKSVLINALLCLLRHSWTCSSNLLEMKTLLFISAQQNKYVE